MEMVEIFKPIMGYGAMGLMVVYLMYKDWKLSESIRDALKEFTISMNMCNRNGGGD